MTLSLRGCEQSQLSNLPWTPRPALNRHCSSVEGFWSSANGFLAVDLTTSQISARLPLIFTSFWRRRFRRRKMQPKQQQLPLDVTRRRKRHGASQSHEIVPSDRFCLEDFGAIHSYNPTLWCSFYVDCPVPPYSSVEERWSSANAFWVVDFTTSQISTRLLHIFTGRRLTFWT